MSGFGFALGFGISRGALAFSLASLFSSGAQGLWTDLQGTPQLYTDTAGTTVAALGDSVARVNDRSGRGNHLTQSTAGNRPVYARHPKTGIRNLLTYTEDFTNAAWSKNASTATAANRVRADGTNNCFLNQAVAATANIHTFTVSMLAVSGQTRSGIGIYQGGFVASSITVVSGPGTTASNDGLHAVSNLSSTVPTVVKITTSGALSAALAYVYVYPGRDQFGGSQISGDTVEYGNLQLETGNTATAYQKVTGWFDVTEAGVPSVPYLYFNGTSTSMSTSAIDFSAGDKMTVFAAVRKLSDAARGMVAEFSNGTGVPGSWQLNAPSGASPTYQIGSQGTNFASASKSSFAAPNSAVITATSIISAPSLVLRVNGSQVANVTSPQGTGNYGNYPLYIGAREGTSLFFNGRLYSLIVRGAQTPLSQIEATELYIKQKMRMP